MEYTTLGKTGLKVSVVGLGCGGPSRLGMRDNADTEERAVGIVREAIDLGVNFIDTAQNYGTEGVVGKAMAGIPRDRFVISTKKTLPDPGQRSPEKRSLCSPKLNPLAASDTGIDQTDPLPSAITISLPSLRQIEKPLIGAICCRRPLPGNACTYTAPDSRPLPVVE